MRGTGGCWWLTVIPEVAGEKATQVSDRAWQLLVLAPEIGDPAVGAVLRDPRIAGKLVCDFGKGRIVVQTANEGSGATTPISDAIFIRMIVWAAGREPERFRSNN